MVEAVRAALLSNAEIFLVTTPEKFSLNESRRAVVALRSLSPDLDLAGIVLEQGRARIAALPNLRADDMPQRVMHVEFFRRHFPA